MTAILDAVDRHHADLIVMSTHGRSGVGRMVYGSVTDQVLHRATVPVMVVPSIVDQPWSSDRPLSALVSLDGSELAEEALEAIQTLTTTGEAQLTLLRVVEPPTYPGYGDGYAYVPFDEEADVATAAKTYLEQQVSLLRGRGWQVHGEVTVGHPAGAIAAIAREQHADLVVMATHGHGGLSRLLLGSTATAVLRQTTVPLLLMRPRPPCSMPNLRPSSRLRHGIQARGIRSGDNVPWWRLRRSNDRGTHEWKFDCSNSSSMV